MESLKDQVKRSRFEKRNTIAMQKLIPLLQRVQPVDKALQKLEKQGYDTYGLLVRFFKLDISPIPLRKNFCAESLSGPVELLQSIAEGKVAVEYVKEKYR